MQPFATMLSLWGRPNLQSSATGCVRLRFGAIAESRSFVESAPRAYRLKVSNAAPSNFNIKRDDSLVAYQEH